MYLKKYVRAARQVPNLQTVSQSTDRIVSASPAAASAIPVTKTAEVAGPLKGRAIQKTSVQRHNTAKGTSVVDLTATQQAKGKMIGYTTTTYQSKQKLELMTRKELEELFGKYEIECVSSYRKADYVRVLNQIENEQYIKELCKQSNNSFKEEVVKGLLYVTRELQNDVLTRIARQQFLEEKVKSMDQQMTSLKNKSDAHKKKITKAKNLLETTKNRCRQMKQNYLKEKNKVSTFETRVEELQEACKEKQNKLSVQVVTLTKERDMWKHSKETAMLKLLAEGFPDAQKSAQIKSLKVENMKYKQLLQDQKNQINEQNRRLRNIKKRRYNPLTPPQTASQLLPQATPVKKRRVQAA